MTEQAFGAPGMPPTWSSSDKDYVTTALGRARIWITVGHGVINEIFWPSTGQPQLRDLTFYLVGDGTFVDLKREQKYTLATPSPNLPLLTITHTGGDYVLVLEIVPDPMRDVLLVRFDLKGPYKLVVLVAPHLDGTGKGNTAWVDEHALVARNGAYSLALRSDGALSHKSAGFVGSSDGWQDLEQHRALTWSFERADDGNVALTGQLEQSQGVLALGFADSPEGASSLAKASLAEGVVESRALFLKEWEAWGRRLHLPKISEALDREALLSVTVLKVHEDRAYPGALVASLSVPWGNSSDTLGGYHLVWPRDATLAAFALLAAGQTQDARHILSHLTATQQDDGHWLQNQWLGGKPFWQGEQLDEAAFPVLLAAALRARGQLDSVPAQDAIERALSYIAINGPATAQDRWEEDAGINVFTLAVAISALVEGSAFLAGEAKLFVLRLADCWNA